MLPYGERGRRGLVQDAHHLEPRELAGELRGLTLQLVEVRGDGDDRFADGGAEGLLGPRLGLPEDERAQLGDRIELAAEEGADGLVLPFAKLVRDTAPHLLELGRAPRAAHQPLGAGDRADAVVEATHLRGVTDEDGARRVKRDDGRDEATTGLVGERVRLSVFEVGDDRVGRPQINADSGHRVRFARPTARVEG